MNFCPSCGHKLISDVKFCPECGYKIAQDEVIMNNTAVYDEEVLDENGTYKLVLVSCGTCNPSLVADLLIDTYGYTSNRAIKLVEYVPVEIAKNLTARQAAYSAQVFTEYGAEVSIVTEDNDYADLTTNVSSKSLFNLDGSLVATAAAVLATLSAVNRVTTYKKVKKPSLLTRIFRTLFKPAQPTHVRRFRPTSRSPFAYRPSMHIEPNPRHRTGSIFHQPKRGKR